MNDDSFRVQLAGLSALPPVVLRGVQYTGPELAMLVAVNPARLDDEANRTPQVISELGRLVAAANRDREMAEALYRHWRDATVHRLTNDLAAATLAGFACTSEGTDAKGKPKPGKLPSRDAAEGYLRTLPEYMDHYKAQADATETWQTLLAALDAAKARTWAIRAFERSGLDESQARDRGPSPPLLTSPLESPGAMGHPPAHLRPPETGANSDPGTGEGGHGSSRKLAGELAALEATATSAPRSPLPPAPPTPGGGRPPPPPPIPRKGGP